MTEVTGLTVIVGKDSVAPAGYTKIPTDLNSNAGGDYMYLCYTNSPDAGPPLTAIQAAASDSNHSSDPTVTPAGYTVIPIDVNQNAGGKYVYISYITGTSAKPICGVDVISGVRNYWPSQEWIRVDQDLNEKAKGDYVYVCYKYWAL